MSNTWNPDHLLSETAFLHAQEGYRPSRLVPIEELSMQGWAERVAAQPELVSARELAGLPESQLSALGKAFAEKPQLPPNRRQRLALTAGTLAMAVGLVGVSVLQARPVGSEDAPVLTALGAALLLGGMAALAVGALMSYRMVPLNAAYGRAGLYVGELNEQHPWLYKTLLLMRDPGAEAYRQKVLKERGTLRGMDYLMMREIASVSEAMVLTQTARSVRDRVQAASGRVPALSKREALVDAGWASTASSSSTGGKSAV